MHFFTRAAVGLLVGLSCLEAAALASRGQVGEVSFSVYAPDWTWQKRDINVLVILTNQGDEAVTIALELGLPRGREDHFDYVATASPAPDVPVEVRIPAQTTVRRAYTGITARDDVPRQVYEFTLRIGAAGQSANIAYPLRTIRGAAVSPGKWALYLPAGVALVWSVGFALVLRRLARPGAWKVPHAVDLSEGKAP